jgi:AraC family transcriptional regulator
MDIADKSYYFGVNKVYEYIDANLAEDLSLGALARASGYSDFHFHRIFHAMTGKTPREYVLERRINTAASRLLYDKSPITRIAFDCGFSSSSSFVRSFSQYFGCAPSRYRSDKERKRPLDLKHAPKIYEPRPEWDALFTAAALPDLLVAGITVKGLSENYESAEIEDAFKRLFAWVVGNGLVWEGLKVTGITLDTPEVVALSECRYFACVTADARFRPDGEISVRTFPTKGKYIGFTLTRSRPDFADAFFARTDYLYGYYMPSIGCFPDNRPFVETYAQRGTDMEITFQVPVV